MEALARPGAAAARRSRTGWSSLWTRASSRGGSPRCPCWTWSRAASCAGLFAVGAELGPLLRVSEPAQGWLDGGAPGAPHRFFLRWRLAAAAP